MAPSSKDLSHNEFEPRRFSFVPFLSILQHKDPEYMRATETHQAHNKRGYPLLALVRGILEAIWSKPPCIARGVE